MAKCLGPNDHLLRHEPSSEIKAQYSPCQEGNDENVTPVLLVGCKGAQKWIWVLCNVVKTVMFPEPRHLMHGAMVPVEPEAARSHS